MKLRPLATPRVLCAGLAAILALIAAACGSDAKPSSAGTKTTAAPDDSSGTAASTASSGAATGGATGAGGCHADLTGGVTASWDAPDGPYAATYGPWTPNGLDNTFFVITCTESGAKNSVTFAGLNTPIELGPQTFTIHSGAQGAAGPMQATVFVDASAWVVSGDGTLTITEFDQHHIAGSFNLPITDAIGNTVTATIAGTFDVTNKDAI